MFTGLVEAIGSIRSIVSNDSESTLVIEAPTICEDLIVGDSVSVNGICLTATHIEAGRFTTVASRETLQRTNLGRSEVGSEVNLERALRLSDRLGGHIVTGHIDGVAVVEQRLEEGASTRFALEVPAPLRRYLAEKGSIAVDGVSLTIAEITPLGCSVVIIPHTLSHTTLGNLQVGETVNIEVDLLAKYVERLLTPTEEEGI